MFYKIGHANTHELFFATMPLLLDLPAFAAALPASGRLMGGDLGTRTLGLALSDEGRRLASPLETFTLTKFTADAGKLAALLAQHKIVGLVLGLPLNMDGSVSPRAQASRQFAENLIAFNKLFRDLPITLYDERLSTAAVERMMIEGDLSRKRRDVLVDKLAASYILQGAMDRMNNDGLNPDAGYKGF